MQSRILQYPLPTAQPVQIIFDERVFWTNSTFVTTSYFMRTSFRGFKGQGHVLGTISEHLGGAISIIVIEVPAVRIAGRSAICVPIHAGVPIHAQHMRQF